MALTDLVQDAQFARCQFVVIDFESLTPAGRSPEPVEVAAVLLHVRDGDLVETARFESLMKPPPDVPVTWRDQEAGITEALLTNVPPASDVMGRLDRLLKGHIRPDAGWPYRLIAHSAGTENTLIAGQREHCPTLAATPLLDSIQLARTALPELNRHGLSELARYLQIPIPADRHRAMADVELTIAVLRTLLQKGPWRTLLDMERDARVEPKRLTKPGVVQTGLF